MLVVPLTTVEVVLIRIPQQLEAAVPHRQIHLSTALLILMYNTQVQQEQIPPPAAVPASIRPNTVQMATRRTKQQNKWLKSTRVGLSMLKRLLIMDNSKMQRLLDLGIVRRRQPV